MTPGFRLSTRFVSHTVGPVWHGGTQGEAQLLAQYYVNSLILAEEADLRSIAFPAISTGVYGHPKAQAVEIAVGTVAAHATRSVRQVIFCCFSAGDLALYEAALARLRA